MRLVLDANEYIFAFGRDSNPDSVRLVDVATTHELRICRTIVQEVVPNLDPEQREGFFLYILKAIGVEPPIDEDYTVPFDLGAAYEAAGLKPADAFIAAYAESIEADVLISENRHFLSRAGHLPFEVMSAKAFLERIGEA